jgi:hypothetical protein
MRRLPSGSSEERSEELENPPVFGHVRQFFRTLYAR